MKTKILISISLLAVAMVAGCSIPGIPGVPGITPTTIGGGKGLEITSFTAEPNTLYSNNTVRIIMEVENQGGATSYNASSFAYLTGSNINLTSTDSIYWRGKDTESTSECQNFSKDMKPADLVKGMPGDTKTIKWNLYAPNVSRGQTRTDTFIGRVYTDYETGANGNIWTYKDAEADAAKASGRSLNKASFTTTSGPVAVEVSVSPDPVIIYGGDKAFTLTIKITNTAEGTIYKPNRPTNCSSKGLITDELNRVNITIRAPDITWQTSCGGDQELITSGAGRSTTIVCDGTVPDVTTFQSFPIEIHVKYGYYTEKRATVTVQGK